MRILFLTPRESKKNIGGVETHVRILTQELEKRGHEVKELSLENAMKPYGGQSSRGLSSGSKLNAWKYLWVRRDQILNADIVHIHDVFWWYLPFRFFFLTKSVFTTFHGWEGEYPPSRSAIFQKRIAQKLSRGTIGIGTFFEKWYGVSPDSVSWGVLDAKFMRLLAPRQTRGYNGGPLRIAFFGRLEEVNGIDFALEAFRMLKGSALSVQGRALRNVEFLFIGDGVARNKVEKIGRVTGMIKNPWQFLLPSDLIITNSYLCILESAALMHPIFSISTNPLKHDYLSTHPLARYISIARSPKELVDCILSYDSRKSKENLRLARDWSAAQTPQKLVDMYLDLWKGHYSN